MPVICQLRKIADMALALRFHYKTYGQLLDQRLSKLLVIMQFIFSHSLRINDFRCWGVDVWQMRLSIIIEYNSGIKGCRARHGRLSSTTECVILKLIEHLTKHRDGWWRKALVKFCQVLVKKTKTFQGVAGLMMACLQQWWWCISMTIYKIWLRCFPCLVTEADEAIFFLWDQTKLRR